MTLVVYPALAAVQPDQWTLAHNAHGRAITPVVALAYGALLLAVGWSIIVTPSAIGVWVALVGAALSMAVTAAVAAPAHGALAAGVEPGLLHRLLVADRIRLGGAVLAVGGAVAAVL